MSVVGDILCTILLWGYWAIVLALVYLSLRYNNISPKAVPRFYKISTILGVYMLGTYGIFLAGLYKLFFDPSNEACLVAHTDPNTLNLLLISAMVAQLLTLIPNYKRVFSIIRGLPHYTFYHATYAFIFIIYSFARIDDLTWGTKGLNTTSNSEDPQMVYIREQNRRKKYKFLAKWMVFNMLFSVVIIWLCNAAAEIKGTVFMFFAWLSCAVLTVRCLLSMVFYGYYFLSFKWRARDYAKSNKKFYIYDARKIETKLENLLNLYFTKAKQDRQLQ